MLSWEKKVPQWDEKKNAKDKKKSWGFKKKNFDNILKLKMTKKLIKALDDNIIFEGDNDNFQPSVVQI